MNNAKDPLSWLETWYHGRSVGEHENGFSVRTIDNPGWLVRANLRGVVTEAMAADRLLAVLGEPPNADNGNLGNDIWMMCKTESGEFIGAGDPTQLRSILTSSHPGTANTRSYGRIRG